jgi:hypothetical protein
LLVALIPLFVVSLARRARRWWFVVPGLAVVVLALYWTHTRSAAAPLVVGLAVVAVLGRDRRLAIIGVGGAVLLLGAYVTSSSLSTQFSAGVDQGSVDVRFERIPSIASYVADHAFTGLGFTGVTSLGFSAVDSAYLLIYGDIGVIGLTMLVLLLVTSVVDAGRGVFAVDPEQRLVAAACAFGVVTLIGAGFAFDSVTQLDDQRILYVLVALGAVVAEQTVGAPRWLAVPTPSRVVAVLVAVGGGLLVYAASPTHVAETFTFSTLSPLTQAVADPPNTGKVLIHTVCNTATVGHFSSKPVQLSCRDPNEGQAPGLFVAGAGQGELRIEAPDAATARAVIVEFVKLVHSEPRLQSFRLYPASNGLQSGRPTVLRTAPVWLPMVIGFGVLMLPDERRRRRDQPPPTDEASPGPSPEPALAAG